MNSKNLELAIKYLNEGKLIVSTFISSENLLRVVDEDEMMCSPKVYNLVSKYSQMAKLEAATKQELEDYLNS